jgi:hypothetical protein
MNYIKVYRGKIFKIRDIRILCEYLSYNEQWAAIYPNDQEYMDSIRKLLDSKLLKMKYEYDQIRHNGPTPVTCLVSPTLSALWLHYNFLKEQSERI